MSNFVVTSKVKSGTQLRVSGDFMDALDKKVADMLKLAEERAKGNGRSTLRPVDI